jgi:hypothetical protein
MSEWISVDDELPPEDQWVLLCEVKKIEMGIRIGNTFHLPDLGYFPVHPNHWMPLPSPPKEK